MQAFERFPSDFGSFSEAVVTRGPGRWIQVAGQVGLEPGGTIVAGGVAAETHRTFDHIERILARADARLQDLVRITVYMTDLADYGAFAAVREERLAPHLPASAAVGVNSLLLGAAIEIDGVAFVADQ